MSIFYSKKVRFKKDIKPKHKTKIKINNGFISPYRFLTTDETGEEKYIYGDSLFVLDFEILEEGTDEEPQPREYKKKEDNEDGFSISFDGDSDSLPF